jgi:hypothetical protein
MSTSLHRLLCVARATLVPVVANLLVHLLSVYAAGERHFFVNFDYFAVPVAYFLADRVIGRLAATVLSGVLLGLLFAADVWGAINGHYFADPSMLFDLLPFATVWPWRLLAPLIVVGFGAAMLLVATSAPARPRWNTLLPALSLLLAAGVADAARPYVPVTSLSHAAFLSSGMANLLRPAINQFRNERIGTVRNPTPISANSFAVGYSADSDAPARILSVGVESWSISRNPETLRRQQEILTRALGGEYEISFGAHQFHGSTLEGEVRELCGLQLNGIPRDALERDSLHDCLPRALAERGYATSGWHGNSGSFYRRSEIYPAIGLQAVYSYEALRPQVGKLCRSLFVGICDADVLRLAAASFVEGRRSFVHVMTLDTHLPLPPPKRACPQRHGAQLCSWEEGIDATLGSIVHALEGARVKPDLVVIYGDHAPPFLDAETRGRFVAGQVPFVALWRHDAGLDGKRLADAVAGRPLDSAAGLLTQR